jgi:ribosomal protein S27AE
METYNCALCEKPIDDLSKAHGIRIEKEGIQKKHFFCKECTPSFVSFYQDMQYEIVTKFINEIFIVEETYKHKCINDTAESKYECIQENDSSELEMNVEINDYCDGIKQDWIESIPVNYCPKCGYKKENHAKEGELKECSR